MYAGGYDARFGGQLSSVLDVTSRNGNLREVSATASIAPFVSSLSLEAPIIPDQLSVLMSGRKSVVDQIADQYISAPLPFDFADAFGNDFTLHAVANPHDIDREPARLFDRAVGYSVITYSPLGAGFLTGKYARSKDQPTSGRISTTSDETEESWWQLPAQAFAFYKLLFQNDERLPL